MERGTVDVAEGIAAAGWRALVASSGGPMVAELARVGAVHHTLPLATKWPLGIWSNIGRLQRLAEAEAVSLIHARSRAPAWSARAAARRLRLPFVTTFHGTYNAGNALKRRYNSVMQAGDRVIAISRFIADHMIAEHGTDPARIRVIPRGVNLAWFDPARVSQQRMVQLAQQWRLPDGPPIAMLPGRLTRWKGQRVFIDALTRLKHLEWFAVIVGGDQGRGSYRAELEAMVEARGLMDRVRLVGECRDMPAAFKLADVVVSASTDPEAFGRVAAEAQAMGKPVVASDHGGSREILLPETTGLLVPPGDSAALAGALAEVFTLSSAERTAIAERAIAHVRANFTRERMVADTLAVYRELL